MIAAILRRTSTGDSGTFGTLEMMGQKFFTGELPDRDNAPEISSIPAGIYECRKTWSNRFGCMMYEIQDVPGRTGVRFHAGNWCGDKSKGLRCDVNGCVLLGMKQIDINGQPAVAESANAVKTFNTLLGGQDFQIAIVDEYLEAGAPPTAA